MATDKLSVAFLRECFEYRDGVLYWRERPDSHFQKKADQMAFNTKSAGKKAGKLSANGYVQIGLRVNGSAISMAGHRIVWALHHGAWPTLHLDHINRQRADNRIENLREVTPAGNSENSSWKRVHPYVAPDTHGRYTAQTKIGGEKSIYLGLFSSEAEACAYRDMVNAELEKLARTFVRRTRKAPTKRGHQVVRTAGTDEGKPTP